jgi:hypothetical protein
MPRPVHHQGALAGDRNGQRGPTAELYGLCPEILAGMPVFYEKSALLDLNKNR